MSDIVFSQRTFLLIPILKKKNLDPSIPSNYRPITLSVSISKILENFILDCRGDYKPSEAQFAFIEGRSTQMAKAIAHDIGTFCNANGSTVYYCSLDIEGAFDAFDSACDGPCVDEFLVCSSGDATYIPG